MAATILQVDSGLRGVLPSGTLTASTLTLPTGVAIDATMRLRGTVMGSYAILVNSPNRPLSVDANWNVRVLTPNAPTAKMTLSGVTSGALSGTYLAKQTFIVYDVFGRLIGESDFGPAASSVTITSKLLRAAGINTAEDKVSGSRLYRTSTGTTTYFQWIDLEGNTQTTLEDDVSDAGLATFAAPSLGAAPDLALVAEFRSRLFGVSKSNPDALNYSEIGAMYAWPEDNVFAAPRSGSDTRGLTGLARRRDALGLGRSNGFYQFTGTSDTDFRIVTISENCGIEAPDSVVVYRDTAWFLWRDGVYQWDASGLKCVSDGMVRSWFTQNNTFNLSRLKYAFAQIDPVRFKYRLFLASAGSPIENCWIEYDITTGKWWGPHTTHAFTPTCAFTVTTNSGLQIPTIGGSDGYIRQERKGRFDDANTGIDFDVVTGRDDQGAPTTEKYFGTLSVATAPSKGDLTVQTVAGDIDKLRVKKTLAASQVDMSTGGNRAHRIGTGKAFKARFRNKEPRVDVELRGYEVDTVVPIGQR